MRPLHAKTAGNNAVAENAGDTFKTRGDLQCCSPTASPERRCNGASAFGLFSGNIKSPIQLNFLFVGST